MRKLSFLQKQIFHLIFQIINLLNNKRKMWNLAIPMIEWLAYKAIVDKADPVDWGGKREREDKFYILFNLLRVAFKAYNCGSPAVRDRMVNLFIHGLLVGNKEKMERFYEQYGMTPPAFITISPEGRCNLQCKDCYAGSLPKGLPHLSARVVEQILQEKYDKWGSWFTVISGGEPFMWNDNGIDIIEIARRHPEQYFLVYTNGTFINEYTANRLAEVGNITPAISVEGFEKETDERRGRGVHKRILTAFENLRNAGVPFGISLTATANNAEMLLSDEMINYYFDQHGVLYAWIFQYMPIGRGVDVSLQVPPFIRKKMWEREQQLLREKRIFIADFWNGGTFTSGCIAGGRSRGYLYIDWNGNIYPCVFVPYWKDNINELFSQGKTLTDALFSDLFKGIREWQKSYSYMRPPDCRGNEIRPCFFRDHHQQAHNLILKTEANPGYPSAKEALHNTDYYNAMIKYDEEIAQVLDPIWKTLYIENRETIAKT